MIRRTIIRPALRLFGMYEVVLARRPVVTQLAVGSSLVVLGDSAAQHLMEGSPLYDHDWRRTSNMVLLRGVVHGSAIIFWYRFLQSKIPMTESGMYTRLGVHLALDQGLFGPANVTFFFIASGLLEGKSREGIKQKLDERLWQTITSAWLVWVG